jgi:hypothetical protein
MAVYPSPDMTDVEIVDLLRALADPTRLEIVKRLADGEPQPKGQSDWDFDCTNGRHCASPASPELLCTDAPTTSSCVELSSIRNFQG